MKFFKRGKGFPVLAVIITAALIAAVFLFLERMELPDDSATRKGRKTAPPKKALKQKTPERRPPVAERREQQIAVIIDDIGYDLGAAEELARIRAPIAFAVLPHTPHAAEAAEILHAAGKEILLHLPMEPRSYPGENPGAGALMADMDEKEIRRQIALDLAAVPYVSGVSNHMGSRFMKDDIRLSVVMDELKKRGLFFVDSRTASDSRGKEAAARARVRFAERSVFIDHTRGYAAALANLTRLPRQGGEGGKPLMMIGHPHPETVRALKEVLPIWQEEGVRMIPVSAYLSASGGKEKENFLVKTR
ncbi:MAG: divergent polysaccharide deacetylase family protein [Proteobacteria bacterium]|nr:divergent polysaccharide deacetylase family protein [Pseudomonadota bacterium]